MNGREFDQFVTPLERLSALEPVILTCVDWARQDATAFTYWPEGRGAFVAYDDGHSVGVPSATRKNAGRLRFD